MKKIFSFVLLTGMLTLMSFGEGKRSINKAEKIYPDCFEAANGAELISCGSEGCNDDLWWYVYNLCLF